MADPYVSSILIGANFTIEHRVGNTSSMCVGMDFPGCSKHGYDSGEVNCRFQCGSVSWWSEKVQRSGCNTMTNTFIYFLVFNVRKTDYPHFLETLQILFRLGGISMQVYNVLLINHLLL